MPHVDLPQAEFKVVLLGDSDSGKTSLALRFVEGHYREGRDATIGAFFLTKRLTLDRMTCKLLLWDTAGQEQFQRLAVTYYKQAAAVLVCYDAAKPTAPERLRHWLAQVQPNLASPACVVCVVACKTDLPPAPGVPEAAAQVAEEAGALHVATSAKADRGVAAAFAQVAELVLQRQQEAAQGRGQPLPVTMGAALSRSPPRRMRSLSPQGAATTPGHGNGQHHHHHRAASDATGAPDRRRNGEGLTTPDTGRGYYMDEKKDDDFRLDTDAKSVTSTPPGIMCDNGLLGCGSDMNPAGGGGCVIL